MARLLSADYGLDAYGGLFQKFDFSDKIINILLAVTLNFPAWENSEFRQTSYFKIKRPAGQNSIA